MSANALDPAIGNPNPSGDTTRGLSFAAPAGQRPAAAPVIPPLEVKLEVVHGDLRYCTEPVFVGHYSDDAIQQAELLLDQLLDGRLSQAQSVREYPGAIGTAALFLPPVAPQGPAIKPRGAAVIGLGKPGELAPGHLTESYRRGVIRLALAHADLIRANQAGTSPDGFVINTLMIGSGEGGLPIDDCTFAIVRAIDEANVKIRTSPGLPPLLQIRFVELYYDTALQIHKTLDRLVGQCRFRCAFTLVPGIYKQGGGRDGQPARAPDGWWRRVQVDEDLNGALSFRLITDRARVERADVQTQTALVDQLISNAVSETAANPATGRTLFALLVPNDLKRIAVDRQDLVLIVDERSARFPWELMTDNRAADARPMAIDAGMVRQLQSLQFRTTPQMAAGDTALVLGDTDSDLPPLPGAEGEARDVAALLQGRAFQVVPLYRPTPDAALNALFGGSYRVLHLAGHGVYRDPPGAPGASGSAPQPPLAGLVLATGMFLTPAEIEQLEGVPELVFINCCHLGQIDRQPYNRLAANVATQFIRMGVRAVVAAGWAVDDTAARSFAVTFYRAMLDGEPFGRAVRIARESIFDLQANRGVNTWGAYQCYGDPFYRLRAARKPARGRFVTSRELATEADNIAMSARGAGKAELQALHAQAQALVDEAKRWTDERSGDARMWAALGLMMGRLTRFGDAVELLERATAAAPADLPATVLEQFHNIRVRYETPRARDPGRSDAQRADSINRIRASLASLERLAQEAQASGAASGRTLVERLALIGGTWKRLALLAAPEERRATIEKMRDAYREAHRTMAGEDKTPIDPASIDPYPLTQWWAAEVALAANTGDGEMAQALRDDGVRWLNVVLQRKSFKESFWTDVAALDAQVVLALLQQGSGTRPAALADGYRRARSRGAQPSEFNSVIDQLQWLQTMLEEGHSRWQARAQELKELVDLLKD